MGQVRNSKRKTQNAKLETQLPLVIMALLLWHAVSVAIDPVRMEPTMVDRIARLLMEFDLQGDHRTGTEGDRKSAEWLAEQLRAAGGIPLVKEFGLERFDPEEAYLLAGTQRIDGLPRFDSALTDANGIEGRIGPAESDCDFGLTEASPHGEYEPNLSKLLAVGKHRAFIIVTKGGLPGLAPINAPRFNRPFPMPVLLVSSRHADQLKKLAEAGENVKLVVRAKRTPAKSFNVMATLPGSQPALSPIVVMTPRTGWYVCAGERGGGLVSWLEVMRAVAPSKPKRPFFFVASGGHELGHLGLERYSADNPDIFKKAHICLHLGANIGARGSNVFVQFSHDDIRTFAQQAHARAGIGIDRLTPPGQRPVGEARNVFEVKGRYLSLLGEPNEVFHHPADRWPDWPDPRRIAALASLYADMAVQLGQEVRP